VQAAVENAAVREPVEILLIEPDTAEARVIEKSLHEGPNQSRINHVRDGVQALAFLRREGAYRQAPRPDLILLDLNLPRVGGSELLDQVRSAPDLRGIPVFVMADHADRDYIAKYANIIGDCVITKPLAAETLAAAICVLAAATRGFGASAANATAAESQLLADLAHELRTHLNPIIAFSEMMKLEIRGPLNGEYREYARGIHQSALSLSRVVFRLLDQSKVVLRR
jgi:two-component system, chemotaxis family, response regulator Rcp1